MNPTEPRSEYTVIVDISHDVLADDAGNESNALFVACTFPDEADAVKYVAEEIAPAVRIERFLAGSTPLALLLITIIGPLSAEDFRAAWQRSSVATLKIRNVVIPAQAGITEHCVFLVLF